MFTGTRRTRLFQVRPCLEALEDRCLLAGNVLQTNLVSDLPGVAQVQDPNLVNPWGISESSGSPFWISDNHAGVSTLYNVPGANNTPVAINPLVVSIPTPGDPLGSTGTPTGTVFNTDGGTLGGFQVSGVDKNGNPITAPAIFLFATEDGTLVGWNPAVNPRGFDPTKAGTYGIIAVDNSGNNFTNPDPNQQTGAVYKGLTSATSATPIIAGDPNSTALLYASNFRAGTIDVYDAAFQKVASLPAGAFTDPNLPKGYAPFDVQVLNNQLYVTYAQQDAAKHDDVAGPGPGFVDVFNLDGTPGLADGKVRLISRGVLDSPWGLAIAPTGFAGLSAPNGDPVLLVGNFGNGRINAFDAATGVSLGGLKDPDGEPIQINGLWALQVGNGGAGGAANTVYFTAGLFGETHGLFGALTTAAPGSPEGTAEAQMIQADLDVVQLSLQALQMDLKASASKTTIRQDVQALDQSLTQLARDEVGFTADTFADLGNGHDHDHEAASRGFDLTALDNVFAGLGKLL
ncbi:MAG TPA: TIGR03118 family protein [Gemmataceae bacterium]|nr:TIGR03118 family protein [Gemmataceae bacterium]